MNNLIKKLIALTLVSVSSIAFAAQMTPLSTVVKTNDFKKDHAMASYLLKRCSAISSVMGGVMIEKMGEQDKGRLYQELGAEYAATSLEIDKAIQNKRNPNSKRTNQEWIQSTQSAVNDLIILYFDDIKRSTSLTGNYFSDSFKSDMKICNNLSQFLK
jgi:hypothetical protein